MRCDLSGLLHNAIGCSRRDPLRGYYEASVDEVIKNLQELKSRTDAGDMSAVQEFFELYVVEGESDGR